MTTKESGKEHFHQIVDRMSSILDSMAEQRLENAKKELVGQMFVSETLDEANTPEQLNKKFNKHNDAELNHLNSLKKRQTGLIGKAIADPNNPETKKEVDSYKKDKRKMELHGKAKDIAYKLMMKNHKDD